MVRANLSWDEMARIEVAIPELPGVSIDQGVTRHYPFGETAAHVVGYVAAVSEQELDGDPLLELPDFRIGKSGVEKSQDSELRGIAGTSQVEVNAFGRVVRELARVPGKPGQDVVTSLDMAMQEFVDPPLQRRAERLERAARRADRRRAGPGLEPELRSGAVLDRAHLRRCGRSCPSDPRKPLSNKVIAGVYPPGSTFKPVVAAAALTAGVLTPETSFTCPGYLAFGDATFHCWRHGGHGTLRLRDAIKKSCDVFFYETARRVGIDRLAAMARRFGFGGVLGIDIPGERPGLIPSREWKLAATGSRLVAGRDIDRGDRPGLGAGNPAAARHDGRAPRHRPGRRAAAGAHRRSDAARRRPCAARFPVARRRPAQRSPSSSTE